MSEAGEATSTTSTAAAAPSSSAPITTAAALPQAPAEAAPQDPAPKSPAGGGAPPAPAPAALVSGNPGGDAAPGTAAPASSAAVGSEDAEKKVLGESGGEDRGGRGGWPLRAGARAAEHVWATPAACLGGMDQGPRGRGAPLDPGAGGRPSRRRCRTKARRSRPPERSWVRKLGVLTGGTLGGRCRAVPWRRIPRCGGERSGSRERGSRVGWKWM